MTETMLDSKAASTSSVEKALPTKAAPEDVFGDEEEHEIRYKTLSWQVRTHSTFVGVLVICPFH